MNSTKSRAVKLVAGVVGFAMAFAFVVTPVSTSALTIAEIQAQIASLTAALSAMTGSPAMTSSYTFNTNLTVGSKGTDVMNLQKVLNMSADTQVSVTGAGAPGMETSTFGPATKAAVVKFQMKNGITPAVGYVGAITRGKLNSMSAPVVVNPGTPGTPSTLPTGGNLMVTAGTQPMNSLAPQSAARIPFTTVVLTAGSADVTVNSITVERSGLAQDAIFSGIVLLDQNGLQIGIAKTLNSNHQAMVGDPFVVKAGTSMTVTVAGNMGASLVSYAGQVAGLNVVAINTTATVAGSLPIMGAMHTVNASLTLGSATVLISSYDPNSAQSKEIGTTGYKFAGVRVTAGSAEQVKLWSIRWNQSGSASSNDLSNVQVYVDGTAYPTTVSADGKYYSALFPGGILLDKGNSKDIYIQGDITGTGAAGRTVRFDLYKTTDLYLSGVTYGYGITPTGSGTGFGTTPWYTGSVVTVSAGSVTSIQKATSVAAQNIAVNVSNQVLGGFTTDIKGEPISVQTLTFTIATTGTWTGSTGITNITIVDQNGAVVAGPVDEASTCTSGCTVTFSDTVTFPVGQKTYTLKGKLPAGAPNGATVVVSATTGSWGNVTGQTTGNTITLGSGTVAMNTMTVKAASLAISVSTSPSAQNIVAGGQGITFANYQFDASQSGEDVRFSTIPLKLTFATAGTANYLTSCQLFDGATALNTGSNTVNPASTLSTAADVSFTLDQQLVIPKGTVKTVTLKCNVSSSAVAPNTFSWGIQSAPSIAVTGVTSSSDVTETVTASVGQTQSVGTSTLAVSLDSSSPSYTIAAAGSTGNLASAFKFRASNDSVNLNRLSLKLTSGSASDVTQVTVWDGATQVGTATFTGNSTYATSTFNTPVVLPKDTDKVLTVKVDFASIGTSQPGTQGDLVAIDFNGFDSTGTQGTGVGSGNTVNATGSTSVAGVRIFKSFPTLALDAISSTGIADGRLMRFKVTANANGSIGIGQFRFTLSTTSATVTQIGLFAYNDSSYSNPISGQGTSGQISAGNTAGAGNGVQFAIAPATNPIQVSANSTVYFELRGSVAGVTTGSSVVTTLSGDASYSGINNKTAVASSTTGFVWSGNATTTSAFTDFDWSNAYGIPGYSASGLIQTRSN